MDQLIIEEPYAFVPPHRGRRWPAWIAGVCPWYLKHRFGIVSHEVRHADRLLATISSDDGVVLVGNHSRPCDPLALGLVTRTIQRPVFCMASWHTFKGSRVERFVIRRCGAFSVHREGADHRSLNFAVDAVASAERPVAVFAEGCLSRSNDYVLPLQEGAALIARMAARKRTKLAPPGKVVAQPVAFKYFFLGRLEETVLPVVTRLEERLTWQPTPEAPLLHRVRRIGDAMLALKEFQYLGAAQAGEIHERIERLVHAVLDPLEEEYHLARRELTGYARVQRLRAAIFPALIDPATTAERKQALRRQLAAIYDCQSLGTYPADYLGDDPPLERIVETVERLEEDMTGENTFHGPWHLVIEIGTAVEVAPRRQRDEADGLMQQMRETLQRTVGAIERPETIAPLLE